MGLRQTLRSWTDGPWVYPTSTLIGVLEASVIPLPMEPVIIPIMASRPKSVWLIALCLVIGNLIAGALIYWVIAELAPTALEPLVAWLGAEVQYDDALKRVREDGFWALVLLDLTPIPFQIGIAAAGAAKFSFPLFLLTVLIARGIRYFALAGLVLAIGSRAQKWIDDHQLELFIGSALIFVALGAWWLLT